MFSLRSELRRKVLTFFYVNRGARVYVRQLTAALGADSTNVSRELARMEREGLLRSEVEGRQLYYSVNREYPWLKPLFELLRGSIGLEPALREALGKVDGIKAAWLYGSFAKSEADARSDIDVLIVGRPDAAELAAEVRKAEQALRREINYTVLNSQEFKRRLAAGDAFVADVWNGKRVQLIGNEDDQTAAGAAPTGEAVPGRRQKGGGHGAQKSRDRRGNRLPDRLPGHAEGLAGADAKPRSAAARPTRSPRRDH
jgi:predicted nucleotidyltransferase